MRRAWLVLFAFVACAPFSADPAASAGDDDDDAARDAGKPARDGGGAADAKKDGPDGELPLSRAEAYAAIVRADKPAAYWRCNEGAVAAQTEDVLGHAPAVFSDAGPHIAVAAGLFSGTSACDFTGIVKQQATANGVELFQPAFTLEIWFNPRTPPDLTYYRHLFEHSEGQTIDSRAYGIFLHDDGSGRGIHSEYYLGGDLGHHLAHAPAPAVGVWHHIVATSHDGLWVDAVKSTMTQTAAGSPSVTQRLAFGAKGNDGDPSVDGLVAEVAVYGHELMDPQILAHWNAGKP